MTGRVFGLTELEGPEEVAPVEEIAGLDLLEIPDPFALDSGIPPVCCAGRSSERAGLGGFWSRLEGSGLGLGAVTFGASVLGATPAVA